MPKKVPKFLGANLDTRPDEAKVKDINIVELVTAVAPVEWKEKDDNDWRSFPKQFQGESGSCVAQTTKKIGGIQLFLKEGNYVEFSATPIYQKRSNKPAAGMIGVEAFDIWAADGLTLEALVDSTKMTDAEMDAAVIEQYERDIAKIFKIKNHVGIPNMDFEQVASVIQQTGKGVMTWFFFTSKEWSKKFPVILDPALTKESGLRHSVAAVDFGLINGKKYIKIEDSAPFGGISERWISEEFFKARNWFNRYPMNFQFQGAPDPFIPPPAEPQPVPPDPLKPIYTFTKPIEFIPLDANGNISDTIKNEAQKADVIALQNILKYEGLFPINVASTGYYGATTARGVYNYQVKHAVAPLSELDAIVPKGGRVGTKTIESLNKIYSH